VGRAHVGFVAGGVGGMQFTPVVEVTGEVRHLRDVEQYPAGDDLRQRVDAELVG
jgi:hypothetical protein